MSQIARRGEEQTNNLDSWWSETDKNVRYRDLLYDEPSRLDNKTFTQKCSLVCFVDLMILYLSSVADLKVDLLDE